MRVLQVVHQFLPKYVGGTEVYVADLSRRLRERGHHIALFAGADLAGQSSWEGMELSTVPGGLRGRRGPAAIFLTTFGNPQAESAFGDVLHRFQPDVVHFHHLLGLSTRLVRLAKAQGVPTCYTLHDYWFVCPTTQLVDHKGDLCRGPVAGVNCGLCAAHRLGSAAWVGAMPLMAPLFSLRQRRVRRALAGVDALLAPSRFLADIAVRAGLPGEKIAVVDFGVALPEAAAAPWQPRPGDAPLRVTYLGAIAWSKGVHVLVDACRNLEPDLAEVQVCGDLAAYPDYSKQLQGSAEGLPVHFLGAVSRERIPELLATSDILVMPSLWYENSPLVLSEAFAASVPVIASRVGALAEAVQDGVNGLLFAKGEPQDLARVLRRLVQEPQLLLRLRSNLGAEKTRSQHVDHMERIYDALVTPSDAAEVMR